MDTSGAPYPDRGQPAGRTDGRGQQPGRGDGRGRIPRGIGTDRGLADRDDRRLGPGQCAQDAFTRALQAFDHDGVQDRPAPRLTTAARNRAVDVLQTAAGMRSHARPLTPARRSCRSPRQPGDRAPDQQHLGPPLEPNREGTALAQAIAQIVLICEWFAGQLRSSPGNAYRIFCSGGTAAARRVIIGIVPVRSVPPSITSSWAQAPTWIPARHRQGDLRVERRHHRLHEGPPIGSPRAPPLRPLSPARPRGLRGAADLAN